MRRERRAINDEDALVGEVDLETSSGVFKMSSSFCIQTGSRILQNMVYRASRYYNTLVANAYVGIV